MTLISSDTVVHWLGTIFFFSAVIHTFLVSKIRHFAHHFNEKTVLRKLFTFLGEVEIVFGFWAFVFLICLSYKFGIDASVEYLNDIDFSEVVFIFAMMCMSYTKPIIDLSNKLIHLAASLLKKVTFLPKKMALFYSIYIFGSLSGSLITEPAAMTVCALLLNEHFFRSSLNFHFKYAMLGLLFVTISIGGTLTIFSSPPVLMVSAPWKLTNSYLFSILGWKAIIAITASTILCSFLFRKDILHSNTISLHARKDTPLVIILVNLVFLAFAITYHKYIAFVIPLFLLFLGFYEVTKEYQKNLKLRESLLVGFFIGGIVVLGGLQSWWIEPLIKSTKFLSVFLGTTGLTAIVDNAAITYLAAQIPNLNFDIKYAFLAGAVAGGGLTVIANAPNPIGYGILNKTFGADGIRPFRLFLWALPPTIIAMLSFIVM